MPVLAVVADCHNNLLSVFGALRMLVRNGDQNAESRIIRADKTASCFLHKNTDDIMMRALDDLHENSFRAFCSAVPDSGLKRNRSFDRVTVHGRKGLSFGNENITVSSKSIRAHETKSASGCHKGSRNVDRLIVHIAVLGIHGNPPLFDQGIQDFRQLASFFLRNLQKAAQFPKPHGLDSLIANQVRDNLFSVFPIHKYSCKKRKAL